GRRYYRTGDHAQHKDGQLFFLGLRDSIVKYCGCLINLDNEVVLALLSGHEVVSAIPMHRQGRLFGFFTRCSIVRMLNEVSHLGMRCQC
ncbi:hypothetical protein DE146DRAFT_606282, partial [Phaeosphaeria sp. MPI-PUGE-AT-0046c]